MASSRNLSILSTMRGWWGHGLAHAGFWPTAQAFVVSLWEFARESTPAQRRQRYGDAEYDWDHRVNTTSATVSWRERLLGQFHSAYQPTEPPLFREMMEMMELLKINFQELTFVDVGSGKGRVLLMAADYPFRRILGIDLLPDLHRVAQENISVYKSESQQSFAVEAVFGDVREFVFPVEPILLYLFNPLPEDWPDRSDHQSRTFAGRISADSVCPVPQSAAGTRAHKTVEIHETRRHTPVFTLSSRLINLPSASFLSGLLPGRNFGNFRAISLGLESSLWPESDRRHDSGRIPNN